MATTTTKRSPRAGTRRIATPTAAPTAARKRASTGASRTARPTGATGTPTIPLVTKRMAQRAGGIKRRRTKLGLSKEEVARRAGCSTTLVGNIERGQIPQRSAALPKVLDVLDTAEKG